MIGDILQPTHLLFILAVALIVLGPKRLPEVGRALGKGLRDFRQAVSGADPREELAELHQSTTVMTHQAVDPTPAATVAAQPEPQPEPEPTPVPAAPPSDPHATE